MKGDNMMAEEITSTRIGGILNLVEDGTAEMIFMSIVVIAKSASDTTKAMDTILGEDTVSIMAVGTGLREVEDALGTPVAHG